MTRPPLRPCSSCARHVHATEERCPFCRASLRAEPVGEFAPQPTATRLARAALFALGTGTLAAGSAASGCDNTTLIPPYGTVPALQPDGGEGAEDASSDAPDGQVGEIDAEGGAVADALSDAAADGATIDAEGDAADAD